jgi:hypothetical protein
VLETVVYRRRVVPGRAWRDHGVTEPFDVYVVAHAWRGRAIDRALDAFVADLWSAAPRAVTLANGVRLDGGGAARLAAYVGHNGWMDRANQRWPRAETATTRRKGFFAIACLTRDYLAQPLGSSTRVPLLMTRDLLFAGSHALDGALGAFAAAGGRDDIAHAAARAYADGEAKPFSRVAKLFTN